MDQQSVWLTQRLRFTPHFLPTVSVVFDELLRTTTETSLTLTNCLSCLTLKIINMLQKCKEFWVFLKFGCSVVRKVSVWRGFQTLFNHLASTSVGVRWHHNNTLTKVCLPNPQAFPYLNHSFRHCRKKELKKKNWDYRYKTTPTEIKGFAQFPHINILNWQLGLKYNYYGPLSSYLKLQLSSFQCLQK